MPDLVMNNLLGIVEHAELTPWVAYRIDRDGHPYVPVGDGGIVLGVHLGDSVFATDGDHVAAGVTLVHPDPAARFGLTAFSCLGNEVVVRSGAATGAVGRVIGKRGESGRVIVAFADEVLERMLPGDRVTVRSVGQGFHPAQLAPEIAVLNVDPALFALLPVRVEGGTGGGSDDEPDGGAAGGVAGSAGGAAGSAAVTVSGVLPSAVCGNGIGRPAQMWDVDLALVADSPDLGGADMRLGELWAIADLDVRHNMGYRGGWMTIGVICHGGSPQPGHGPGLVPLLSGPAELLRAVVDASAGPALTEELLAALGGASTGSGSAGGGSARSASAGSASAGSGSADSGEGAAL